MTRSDRTAVALLATAVAVACAGCASVRGTSSIFGSPQAAASTEGAPPIGAQELQIQPDRPDLTNAAYTVPPALAQLETGGQRTRVRDSGQTFATPVSVRIGVTNWMEARVETSGFTRSKEESGPTSGFGGLSLGGKIRVWAPRDGAPAIALQPSITIPSGRGEGAGTDYELTLITGRDITDWLHLDANYAITAAAQATSHFLQHQLSASSSVAIGERWAPYVEIYWLSKASPDTRGTATLDLGAIYTIRQRLAVDGGAMFGLTSGADGPALFAGLSVILGELTGHKGIDARLREAHRRGDR